MLTKAKLSRTESNEVTQGQERGRAKYDPRIQFYVQKLFSLDLLLSRNKTKQRIKPRSA